MMIMMVMMTMIFDYLGERFENKSLKTTDKKQNEKKKRKKKKKKHSNFSNMDLTNDINMIRNHFMYPREREREREILI